MKGNYSEYIIVDPVWDKQIKVFFSANELRDQTEDLDSEEIDDLILKMEDCNKSINKLGHCFDFNLSKNTPEAIFFNRSIYYAIIDNFIYAESLLNLIRKKCDEEFILGLFENFENKILVFLQEQGVWLDKQDISLRKKNRLNNGTRSS